MPYRTPCQWDRFPRNSTAGSTLLPGNLLESAAAEMGRHLVRHKGFYMNREQNKILINEQPQVSLSGFPAIVGLNENLGYWSIAVGNDSLNVVCMRARGRSESENPTADN